MKKYFFALFLFIIALISINNVYALDGSYSSSNFRIFYYDSPSGGTRLSSSYSSGLDISHPLNGGYLEGLYIQVFGNNNIIYKAGNTYTFTFRVNFNPKNYSSLDNNYTTSNLKVFGSPNASSSDMSVDNITSSSLSISDISGNTYQMIYTFKVVPDIDLKYILFQCLYPYSLLGSNLDYVYALNTVRVVDLSVTYQQGIGSAIDNQTIVIQNQTDNIINNNNQNTNSIINNNNQNTNSIINNQNENTDKQIESQLVCREYDLTNTISFGFLDGLGSVSSTNNSKVTDFISISSNDKLIKLSQPSQYQNNLCFYDSNKSYISCLSRTDYESLTNITIPSNANFVRFTINVTENKPQFKICKNGNQALSDGINNVNDTLNNSDSSGATDDAGSFFSGFSTNTFGLTSIITSPLNLINSLTSKTCSPLHLQIPYVNKTMDLPCMSTIYQQYFGSFMTIYQTITFGIISYWVCIRIFALVKDFKNPDHDEIEVMDL